MPFINRGIIQDQMQSCKSRHAYMANSIDPTDRANAEAYRLAANAYQDLANDLIEPENMPEELDVYVTRFREAWDRFFKTGLIDDEIAVLENDHIATLVKADGSPAAKATPTRRPRMERELREYVNPRTVETVAAEMCLLLGLEYKDPSPQEQWETSGLVKHRAEPEPEPAPDPSPAKQGKKELTAAAK